MIAGLYSKRVLSFVTRSHTASQTAFSRSQQQLMNIPLAVHPYQHFMLVLHILAILIDAL